MENSIKSSHRGQYLMVWLTLTTLLTLSGYTSAFSQMRLSKLFQDGMVMQRNAKVPVWGWAEKGEKIKIEFNGQMYNAKPETNGKWKILLPAMKAGGPYELKTSGKKDTYIVKDIWIGDVWICSGQSNMEWVVANSNDAEIEIANASDKNIRHFKIPHSSAEKPEMELADGSWQICSPETVGAFTAVGYFFARELRKDVDVPIGLINTSWGGSRVEPWMSAEDLGIEDIGSVLMEINAKREAEAKKRLQVFQEKFGSITKEDAGMNGDEFLWAVEDLDESKWVDIEVPKLWEQCGYEGFDGIGWYRTSFELSAQEAQSGIDLGLAKIDDSDKVWINGTLVGGMQAAYNVDRIYQVKAATLKQGINVIAVRVEDTGGGGGIYGDPGLMYIKTNGRSIPISGTWKFRIGAFIIGSGGMGINQTPTLLYNKMIYPLLDFPIKGALWYQGESNAGTPEDATKYKQLFSGMIMDWRNRWGQGDFPFLFVQLANFMVADEVPTSSPWALLRESQTATLELSNTGQAIIIDIGESDDIHPRNKQDVGLRLSLLARKIAYGEDILASGPTYASHSVEGNMITVEFESIGDGFLVKDKYGYLKGFAIAGADKKFYWAKGMVKDGKVILWSEDVDKPTAIRYAWGNNPEDANLYNQEDLPASPFRTDEW